jgi:hypothetical protein
MLFEAYRDDFGCEQEDCTCEKHLKLDGYDEPDSAWLARIRFLVRLEGIVSVGGRFHVNDLSLETWHDLMELKRQRGWIDKEVREQHDRIRKAKQMEEKGLEIARKEAGNVPPPGHSLFPKAR